MGMVARRGPVPPSRVGLHSSSWRQASIARGIHKGGGHCVFCVWCLVVTDRGTHNTQMSFRSVDLRRVDLFVDLLVDLGGDDRWWLENTQMSLRTVDLGRVDLAVYFSC